MRNLLICVCLIAITFAVYWPVHRFEFVNYDDSGYIYENPRTLQGLTWQNFCYAFRSTVAANYHPLIWISLALDVSICGPNPRAMHLENAFIHAVSTGLLFLFLACATGNVRPAIFCAIIFGVHPLHVESVAWITERKDTLSGFFFILALLSYLGYVRSPSRAGKWFSYIAMSLLLILGLLSKSSLATFPFVLLLFDFWPLDRLFPLRRSIFLEKLPLLFFCAVGSVATYIAQHIGGAVVDLTSLPVTDRLANAAISYCRYLGKFCWPTNLSVYYPRLRIFPVSTVALSLLVIASITAVCLRLRRRAPFFIVGWLFFLGVLVPMIGLVQVGWQSIADRYMYLAIIGPGIMLAWGGDALVSRMKSPSQAHYISAAVAAVVSIILASVTIHQLQYWHDTRTLFNHSIAVTPENAIAHLQLGYLDASLGHVADAKKHYLEAIRLEPDYYIPDFNLANLLLHNGHPDQAIDYYQKAADNQPGLAKIEINWGIALLNANRPRDAFEHFRAAVQDDPDFADGHFNLGQLYLQAGKLDSAEVEFQTALKLFPNSVEAKKGLADVQKARAERGT
jgi:Tfp pilus assembly protein PilF